MKKILFLCSRNKLRSPTAEAVFSDIKDWKVYSAGMSKDADIPVSVEDIEWADYIFVMEKRHKRKLQNKFGHAIKGQLVICLDIPDNFVYMDEKLIDILQAKVPKLVH